MRRARACHAAGTLAPSAIAAAQSLPALRYYATYREEIDDWIRRVDDEAERAEATWRLEQDLLRR